MGPDGPSFPRSAGYATGVNAVIPKPAAAERAGTLRVRPLRVGEEAAWDAFVNHCPESTFFHRVGWKSVIERAYGHATHYLCADVDGTIEGVLPLGHIRSRLFGNALISTPFAVYGGAIGTSETVRTALENAAEDLAVHLNVDYLELRTQTRTRPSWEFTDLYVTFRKTLDPNPEANLAAIPRKQRAMVRKGIKAGLRSEVDGDIDRFFYAYSTSVRNLGTPIFPRKYFAILKSVFAEDCELLTVVKDGETISSVMSFYFRDEVLPYYGGGTDRARELKGNDFMYWELMRRACEKGVRVFDYGRSKEGTGSYSFKKNWGFSPAPLSYQYRLVKTSQMPEVNPTNPKYRMLIQMWRRLPLWAANRLGPFISRSLG
jgi:FemAB-related protein (PEP-CTERM system-associated)